MGGTADTDGSLRARVRTWFAELQVSQLWQLVILLVLGVTAVFGGLDTVDTRIHAAEVGKPFSDGQFTLTVERASLIHDLQVGSRTVLPAKPDRHYLGVVAVIRNDGTIPGQLDRELKLQNMPGAEPQVARRMRDSEPVTSIGPGLTEELAFFWSIPESALEEGDSITLRVYDKKSTELLTTYGKAWVDSNTDYTTVSIPVRIKT